MPPRSRTAEAILLVLALHGGTMGRAACEAEILRLGLLRMSDEMFEAWKASIGEELAAAFETAFANGKLP